VAADEAPSRARRTFPVTVLRPARPVFINDLTGPFYIVNPRTKNATTYLDFNGRGSRTGLFDKLTTDAGLASGFISFEFDPDYVRNGRFSR
jgi:hypothetical protein